jgi:hypothetical protein
MAYFGLTWQDFRPVEEVVCFLGKLAAAEGRHRFVVSALANETVPPGVDIVSVIDFSGRTGLWFSALMSDMSRLEALENAATLLRAFVKLAEEEMKSFPELVDVLAKKLKAESNMRSFVLGKFEAIVEGIIPRLRKVR